MTQDFCIKGFNQNDSEWLFSHGQKRIITENEKLINKGEIPNELFIIINGLFSAVSDNDEQFALIGPGGIIGGMTFFTKNVSPLSYVAIEPDNAVLSIPYTTITKNINEDPDFALRFHRLLAVALSERMLKVINLFISSFKPQKIPKICSTIQGPVSLFVDNQPDFRMIQDILNTLPTLASVLKKMNSKDDLYAFLIHREKKLSVATMAAASINLLRQIGNEEGLTDLDKRIINHEPTLTAAEKQALLPNCYVQKTLTILIQNNFVLCSGLGDFKVHHGLLNQITESLGCEHSISDSYINPSIFVPEIELGLLRGMVSTFFSPNRITQLNSVVLTPPNHDQKKEVAISLSPFESLLLPYDMFPKIVTQFAKKAYPYIPFKLLE